MNTNILEALQMNGWTPIKSDYEDKHSVTLGNPSYKWTKVWAGETQGRCRIDVMIDNAHPGRSDLWYEFRKIDNHTMSVDTSRAPERISSEFARKLTRAINAAEEIAAKSFAEIEQSRAMASGLIERHPGARIEENAGLSKATLWINDYETNVSISAKISLYGNAYFTVEISGQGMQTFEDVMNAAKHFANSK